MQQDAPRHDVETDHRLLDFDSEAPNNVNEPVAARDGSEPGAIYDSRELDVAFGSDRTGQRSRR